MFIYPVDKMAANETDVYAENVFLCFPLRLDSCLSAQRLTTVKVAMYILMLLIIFLTVFGNLLVVVSISYFKHLQSPTHLIVQSLAACDCLLGSLVMPYSMVRSIEGCWYLGDVICKVHSSLDMTLSISSKMHLSLISVDRYWAICDPLMYRTRVTNYSITVFIMCAWLFAFVYSFSIVFSEVNLIGLEVLVLQISCLGSCVLLFNKPSALICSILTFFLPGAIMSSLYVKIFRVASKHAKVLSERVSVLEIKSQTYAQRERKAAKIVAIVVGAFLLCWLPFFVATALDPFLDFWTPADVFDALVWFGYFNSTCNPLIYGFFYPRFQKAFKILMSTVMCGSSSSRTLAFG
ncbi:trace amine-associated receptor 4 [Danio rerio]|uniref:Trace amine-associated receptor 4 n=2 Tax=Danio rerio TaxID=7955 RepID=A0AB40E6I6_DANRE|nr:trace amine-associated receptor 4 [Danio rerio]|eukprot:XP_001920844.2 trace amine-associated receptor 4 [Danio rerio]